MKDLENPLIIFPPLHNYPQLCVSHSIPIGNKGFRSEDCFCKAVVYPVLMMCCTSWTEQWLHKGPHFWSSRSSQSHWGGKTKAFSLPEGEYLKLSNYSKTRICREAEKTFCFKNLLHLSFPWSKRRVVNEEAEKGRRVLFVLSYWGHFRTGTGKGQRQIV